MKYFPLLITSVVMAWCGAAIGEEPAKDDSPDSGFFDLFGRRVERGAQNIDGALPEGALEIVAPPKRSPRLALKKKASVKVTAAPPVPRIPANARPISWSNRFSDVNSGSVSATHVIKNGDRVVLRSFGQ